MLKKFEVKKSREMRKRAQNERGAELGVQGRWTEGSQWKMRDRKANGGNVRGSKRESQRGSRTCMPRLDSIDNRREERGGEDELGK
jgi:hypothetical protein